MAPLYSKRGPNGVFDFLIAHDDPKELLTFQMAIDYIGPSALGARLQVNPCVVYAGKTHGVIDDLVFADDTLVARAGAAFRPAIQPHRFGGCRFR